MMRAGVLLAGLLAGQGLVLAQGQGAYGGYGLTPQVAQSLQEMRLRRSQEAILQAPAISERMRAELVELQDQQLNSAILRDQSSLRAWQKASARLRIDELSRIAATPEGEAVLGSAGWNSDMLRKLSLRPEAPEKELAMLKRRYGVDAQGRLLLRPETLIVLPELAAPSELPAGRLPQGYKGPPVVWRNGLLFSVAIGTVDSEGVQRAFCSGTLVDKQWVVTAAHCLRWQGRRLDARELFAYLPFQAGTLSVRNIAGGWDLRMRKLSVTEAKWAGDANKERFPLSDQDIGAMVQTGADLALLKLSDADVDALPVSIPDVRIVPAAAVQAPVTMVGYGLSNEQAADSLSMSVGVLNSLPTGIAAGRDVFISGNSSKVGSGLCGGDSGGGIFAGRLDGAPTTSRDLFGVISGLYGEGDSTQVQYCLSHQQIFTPLLSDRNRNFVCKAAVKACPG